MSTIISIENLKGGVGKSATALNLGAALAASGKRVLLVDADVQGNLTAALGFTPGEIKNTLAKLFLTAIDNPEDLELQAERAILQTESGVDLIPANRRLGDKALLGAKNRKGHRFDLENPTSGENRPMYSARKQVAAFFGVTEYEVRKLIKLAGLIPELLEILDNRPRQLNLSCADLIADYDEPSQAAFIEICSIEGYQLNKATLQHIMKQCPPPTAERCNIISAWREARAIEEKHTTAPPKKITFDRKKFAPYLEKLDNDSKLEDLFLEFLKQKLG